jgi:hypothetical protein
MTRQDLAALRRCIEVAERDPMRREQVLKAAPTPQGAVLLLGGPIRGIRFAAVGMPALRERAGPQR